jgi:hypothetical protein
MKQCLTTPAVETLCALMECIAQVAISTHVQYPQLTYMVEARGLCETVLM